MASGGVMYDVVTLLPSGFRNLSPFLQALIVFIVIVHVLVIGAITVVHATSKREPDVKGKFR